MSFFMYKIINSVFGLLELAILIECIASWIPQLRYNSFMEAISKITTPILEPFRQLQDRFLGNMPVDFSPILALVAIRIMQSLLFTILEMIF